MQTQTKFQKKISVTFFFKAAAWSSFLPVTDSGVTLVLEFSFLWCKQISFVVGIWQCNAHSVADIVTSC